MKKTLLTIFAGVLTASFASAQCTPDPAYANASGNFFPDSLTFITDESAMAGVDYDAVLDIKTITDTAVSTQFGNIDATIDAFRILEVAGAPAGFSWTGGGATYETADPRPDFGQTQTDSTYWNVYGTANDPTTLEVVQGCIQFTAAAADVAAAAPAAAAPELYTDYPVVVTVDARLSSNTLGVPTILADGDWLSDLPPSLGGPLTVTSYVLRVFKATGVAEMLNLNAFDVAQSYPNPADETATISYTTPNSTKIQLNVYNMLGGLVYSESATSQKGMNKIELETASMTAGMYVYTVSNGVKTVTKRMTIN